MATDPVVGNSRGRQRGIRGEKSERPVSAGLGAERGTVTAESALVLPIIAFFVLALLWMLAIGIAKVQTVDAARDAARAMARGDGSAAAIEVAQRSAPTGAHISVAANGSDRVTVTVTVRAEAPGWLLVPLPAVSIGSTATTPVESPHAGG